MAITKTTVQPVQTGETISPTNTNRPILELEQNIDSILTYINGGSWDGGTFTSAVTINSDLTVTGVINVTGTGQVLNLSTNSNTDAHITFGDPAANWLIKYVGSTTGTNGNEFGVFSNGYGPGGFQIDHLGNMDVINGSGTFGVWHSGNDGAGSGLDADLLDGLQSTQFLRSDADDTFTFLTGSKLYMGGPIDGQSASAASLQVNGFMRVGTVFLHDVGAGNDPQSSAVDLRNTGGVLMYGASTVWHSGNDGTGSGLDADTVDTLQASQFLRSDTSDTITGNLTVTGDLTVDDVLANSLRYTTAYPLTASTDLNTVTTGGFYDVNTPVNGPIGSGWVYLEVIRHRSDNGHVLQKATDLTTGNGVTYYRTQVGGVWGSWHKFWTDTNDGPGSGLNADLLDNMNSASFLRSNADDQMDAKLTIISTGSIAGATWDNGWLKVGTSSVGWAIDSNEIVNSAMGIIGTLSNALELKPATEVTVYADVNVKENATKYTSVDGSTGVRVEYNETAKSLEYNFY